MLRWFINDRQQFNYDHVLGYIEYKRDGKTYRCHPNYRSAGPWYDWAIFRFDCSEDDDESDFPGAYGKDEYPCKILCFFHDPEENQICALVHCCVDSTHEDDSVICERWNLEYTQQHRKHVTDMDGKHTQRNQMILVPVIRSVPVDSIVDRVFVVEETPGIHESLNMDNPDHSTLVLLVKDRDQHWACNFT